MRIAGATLENLQIDIRIKHTVVIRAASSDFQYYCVSIGSVLQVMTVRCACLESCTVPCAKSLLTGIGHENHFLEQAANIVIVGPNGLCKSMIARNLLHQAVLRGYTARFTAASDMLHELAAQDSSTQLARWLRRYTTPALLGVDEVGYLAYDTRYADLLFEVTTRRYQLRRPLVITNKTFSEWNQVFPNATCVVALVDRLVHRSEILSIDGESYRLKEARERAARRATQRPAGKKTRSTRSAHATE